MPTLTVKHYTEKGTKYRLTVEGGLHYIKGNSTPYFSLTADIEYKAKNNKWYIDSCECQHDQILQRFPEFSDLAALHLSDIDGIPMHAVADALYWASGAMDRTFDEYHGGNGSTPKSKEECLKILSSHLRISEHEAQDLVASLDEVTNRIFTGPAQSPEQHKKQVAEWKTKCTRVMTAFVNEQKPRWKKEADDCVNKHQLVVYGDKWEEK